LYTQMTVKSIFGIILSRRKDLS